MSDAWSEFEEAIHRTVTLERGHGVGEDEIRQQAIRELKMQFVERVEKERVKAVSDGVASFDLALAAADLALFLAWESEES